MIERLKKRGILIRCPGRRKPQFRIVEDGIEVKCYSCKNETFYLDKAKIERIWLELAAGGPVLGQPSV